MSSTNQTKIKFSKWELDRRGVAWVKMELLTKFNFENQNQLMNLKISNP